MDTTLAIYLAIFLVSLLVSLAVVFILSKRYEIKIQRKANMDFASMGLKPPYMQRYAKDYVNAKFHLIPPAIWWIEEGPRRRRLAREKLAQAAEPRSSS